MKDLNKMGGCCGAEIAGIILLVIATILTIVTLNGWGIFAMFLVGGALCCHKHWHCNDYICEENPVAKIKDSVKKVVNKKVEPE